MHTLNLSWPWISLAFLGAFHGVNPAMGWLFAVAIGFQERQLRAVVAALGPIALGHMLAIGSVAVVFGLFGLAVPETTLLIAIGLVLIAFAAWKIGTRFRHPRWAGTRMRVRRHELILWSFLMATAHGAGLMIVPFLAGLRGQADSVAMANMPHAEHMAMMAHADHGAVQPITESSIGSGSAAAAVMVHSLSMLLVSGVIAVIVYQRVGVGVLRRYWVNFDLLWVGALMLAGAVTLAIGLWSIVLE